VSWQQLHTPKCGGLALAAALGGQGHRWGHSSRLRDLPDPAITVIRDPVARWVSAYDMVARQFKQWPEADGLTASTAALSDEWRSWLRERFPHVWYPLHRWLRTPAYVLHRGVVVLRTETLDRDWLDVKARYGLTGTLPRPGERHRNDHAQHGTVRSSLTPRAEARLRDLYADDYWFLETL